MALVSQDSSEHKETVALSVTMRGSCFILHDSFLYVCCQCRLRDQAFFKFRPILQDHAQELARQWYLFNLKETGVIVVCIAQECLFVDVAFVMTPVAYKK